MALSRDVCLQKLRLKDGASDEEIRKAYKNLAYQSHPDRNEDSEESTRKFQEISRAYFDLSTKYSKKAWIRWHGDLPYLCPECMVLHFCGDCDEDDEYFDEDDYFDDDEYTDDDDDGDDENDKNLEEIRDDEFTKLNDEEKSSEKNTNVDNEDIMEQSSLELEIDFHMYMEKRLNSLDGFQSKKKRQKQPYSDEEKEEDNFFDLIYQKYKSANDKDFDLTAEDLQKFHSYEEWLKDRHPKKRHNHRVRKARKKASSKISKEKPKPSKKQLLAEQNRRKREMKTIREQIQMKLKQEKTNIQNTKKNTQDGVIQKFDFVSDMDTSKSVDTSGAKLSLKTGNLNSKKQRRKEMKEAKKQVQQEALKCLKEMSGSEEIAPKYVISESGSSFSSWDRLQNHKEQKCQSRDQGCQEMPSENITEHPSKNMCEPEVKSRLLEQLLLPNISTSSKTKPRTDINALQHSTWDYTPVRSESAKDAELLQKHLQQYHELMKIQPKRHTEQQLAAERTKQKEEQLKKKQKELDMLRNQKSGELDSNLLKESSALEDIAIHEEFNRIRKEQLKKQQELERKRNQEEMMQIKSLKKGKWRQVQIETKWYEKNVETVRQPLHIKAPPECPIPTVNVWQQRVTRQNQLESLRPHNPTEENDLIRKAIELSLKSAAQDEERRKYREIMESKSFIPQQLVVDKPNSTDLNNNSSRDVAQEKVNTVEKYEEAMEIQPSSLSSDYLRKKKLNAKCTFVDGKYIPPRREQNDTEGLYYLKQTLAQCCVNTAQNQPAGTLASFNTSTSTPCVPPGQADYDISASEYWKQPVSNTQRTITLQDLPFCEKKVPIEGKGKNKPGKELKENMERDSETVESKDSWGMKSSKSTEDWITIPFKNTPQQKASLPVEKNLSKSFTKSNSNTSSLSKKEMKILNVTSSGNEPRKGSISETKKASFPVGKIFEENVSSKSKQVKQVLVEKVNELKGEILDSQWNSDVAQVNHHENQKMHCESRGRHKCDKENHNHILNSHVSPQKPSQENWEDEIEEFHLPFKLPTTCDRYIKWQNFEKTVREKEMKKESSLKAASVKTSIPCARMKNEHPQKSVIIGKPTNELEGQSPRASVSHVIDESVKTEEQSFGTEAPLKTLSDDSSSSQMSNIFNDQDKKELTPAEDVMAAIDALQEMNSKRFPTTESLFKPHTFRPAVLSTNTATQNPESGAIEIVDKNNCLKEIFKNSLPKSTSCLEDWEEEVFDDKTVSMAHSEIPFVQKDFKLSYVENKASDKTQISNASIPKSIDIAKTQSAGVSENLSSHHAVLSHQLESQACNQILKDTNDQTFSPVLKDSNMSESKMFSGENGKPAKDRIKMSSMLDKMSLIGMKPNPIRKIDDKGKSLQIPKVPLCVDKTAIEPKSEIQSFKQNPMKSITISTTVHSNTNTEGKTSYTIDSKNTSFNKKEWIKCESICKNSVSTVVNVETNYVDKQEKGITPVFKECEGISSADHRLPVLKQLNNRAPHSRYLPRLPKKFLETENSDKSQNLNSTNNLQSRQMDLPKILKDTLQVNSNNDLKLTCNPDHLDQTHLYERTETQVKTVNQSGKESSGQQSLNSDLISHSAVTNEVPSSTCFTSQHIKTCVSSPHPNPTTSDVNVKTSITHSDTNSDTASHQFPAPELGLPAGLPPHLVQAYLQYIQQTSMEPASTSLGMMPSLIGVPLMPPLGTTIFPTIIPMTANVFPLTDSIAPLCGMQGTLAFPHLQNKTSIDPSKKSGPADPIPSESKDWFCQEQSQTSATEVNDWRSQSEKNAQMKKHTSEHESPENDEGSTHPSEGSISDLDDEAIISFKRDKSNSKQHIGKPQISSLQPTGCDAIDKLFTQHAVSSSDSVLSSDGRGSKEVEIRRQSTCIDVSKKLPASLQKKKAQTEAVQQILSKIALEKRPQVDPKEVYQMERWG